MGRHQDGTSVRKHFPVLCHNINHSVSAKLSVAEHLIEPIYLRLATPHFHPSPRDMSSRLALSLQGARRATNRADHRTSI